MEHGFINLTPENIMGEHKGHGYGRQLMEYCLNDAKERGKSGVCMLGAEKQKAWLSDQAFAMKYGFEEVDSTKDGYKLLALSFDGTLPHFAPNAKRQAIENKELMVYAVSLYPPEGRNAEGALRRKGDTRLLRSGGDA